MSEHADWLSETTCDGCGETWERTFICDECSSGATLEPTMTPVLDWAGVGPEYEETEEWVPNGTICFNCCVGHKTT